MQNIISYAVIIIFGIIFSPNLYAQNSINQSFYKMPNKSLMELFGGLFLILIILLFFILFLKKIDTKKSRYSQGLRVIRSISLGRKEKLIIIEVGEDQLLLGVTEKNINKIYNMPKKLKESNDENKKSSDFFNNQKIPQ